MSTKIKALNEEELSFETDPEINGKPSKEAQEELSISKYNEALKTLKEGRRRDAVDILEEIVASFDELKIPSDDDLKQLSLPQQKLQLGCLKILGDLYRDGDCKNLERCKIMYERAIYYDQAENNINFWYRLGKVCFEIGDVYSAHMAFGHALNLRPGHWGCLEHMVTVSYAIQDYAGCIKHCSAGLILDPGFYKGRVFQELVYSVLPELDKRGTEDKTVTSVPIESQRLWKERYLEELRKLQDRAYHRRVSIQRQISIPTPKIQFSLKSLSLVEVLKEVLVAYERSFGTPEFHKAVEVTWVLQDGNVEIEDTSKPMTNEESQTEEESQSQIRSRSSSDDKDTNTVPSDTTSQQGQDANCGEKTATENGTEGQQSDFQLQNAENDAGNKKKKRDVKWWQMEGKRRSQRVRGHLMPVSPDKTKKESSFADQLKNLFPAPLLGDDGTSSERESAKTTEKSVWQKKHHPHYFGTKEEETHVKQLLVQMTGTNFASILSSLVEFLTTNVKYPWPSELREAFILLYQHFRSYVSYPNIQTYDITQVIKDAFSCISFVEVVIEKYKTELSLGDKDFCKLAEKEIFFLEDCLKSSDPVPKDLILRVKWVTVRRLLQMSLASNDDEVNGVVCSILSEMEADLRSSEPITVWTVNEISNLICLESVTEKAIGITKMQNSQVVTDLYQSHQYESLIGVLQTCINFSEIEKRDLSDIFYYTDALYRTNNSDCIHHCLNLINQAIRFQDNSSLAEALVLLEEIWEKMSHRFDLQDKRSIVGSLLKILVACERKPPSQESVLSVPWCLLHSVLFSLEREEPAFYLEEDTVPNSVLLLQMAHECISRSEKCCVDNGKLMLYTMKEILKTKKLDEYFIYEETKLCMEQAIFCLYSHPSKKSKVKNLKDHNSQGSTLTWEMCPTLYQYYCPDEIPEFDSTFSITTDTEGLYQRLLEIMPEELNPAERQKQIERAITKAEKLEVTVETDKCFPKEIKDIYYLIGDYYFKSKEWSKAVKYYTLDLAVNLSRFDSWAAIALCLGESIYTNLNTADVIEFKDLAGEASSTGFCFNNALIYDPANIKLRIEYGSFSYAIHACCSRLMKQQQATDIDMMKFQTIERSRDEFLKCSRKCFELTAKSTSVADSTAEETAEDELWIHHYMLGKINEKMKEDAEEFLKQYELAGKLLHVQGAPYPSKMNYYSPPELAIEALEIYYRVHASILSLVETAEYSVETEKLYLQFIRRQENSPFIKCKQGRGDGSENKRGRKAAEDTVSKKDMAEISSLLNDLVQQAEKLVESGTIQSTTSSAPSTTTTEDDTSTDSVKSVIPKPPVHSFSLSEFQKRLQEREEREEKLATESKKVDEPGSSTTPTSPEKPEDIYEGLQLDSNIFYPDFKNVKYGGVISLCLKAMEECISRYPSHFKSYYRLAHSYLFFISDAKRAKEYLMGSPTLSQRKIAGLFGERKPTNFFNGIWRNPIDDIDRPGSFSYHMNKSMHLLMDVLSRLNDHSLLADIGIYLTKVPDNEKKYLSNPDREMFCQQAWNGSVAAVKKICAELSGNFNDLGTEIYDTYTKFQKHNPRGCNNVAGYLHDLYRKLIINQGASDDCITADHALRYFSTQHFLNKQQINRGNSKGSFGQSGDPLKSGYDGPPPRKRGRRNLRQTSQESVVTPLPTHQPDLEMYGAAFAAAFQGGTLDLHKNPSSMLPLPLSTFLAGLPSTSAYPTMNIDPVQAVLNNQLLNLTRGDAANRGAKTPPNVHDSSKGAKGPSSSAQYPHSSGFVPGQQTQSSSKEFSSDKDRSSANVSNQTQPRPKAVRKNSKQEGSKETSKYPPPPSTQQIRLNTSPYKTQSAVVSPPPEFSYKKKNTPGTSNKPSERSTPPAAHHQPKTATQTEITLEDDEIVEVIDLTVKTPEKDKKESNFADRPIKTPKPLVSNPVFKSNPRLPTPTFVDLRARAENPHPIIPNIPSRVTVVTTRPNISPSQEVIVPIPRPPALNQRPVIQNPRPTVPQPKLNLPNSRLTILPIPRPNHAIPRASSSSSNPRPGTSNPRPVVPNQRIRPPVAQYPLPPKKKHQQYEYLEVQNTEEDDVESGNQSPSAPPLQS